VRFVDVYSITLLRGVNVVVSTEKGIALVNYVNPGPQRTVTFRSICKLIHSGD